MTHHLITPIAASSEPRWEARRLWREHPEARPDIQWAAEQLAARETWSPLPEHPPAPPVMTDEQQQRALRWCAVARGRLMALAARERPAETRDGYGPATAPALVKR